MAQGGNEFNAIRISLASPDQIKTWSYVSTCARILSSPLTARITIPCGHLPALTRIFRAGENAILALSPVNPEGLPKSTQDCPNPGNARTINKK